MKYKLILIFSLITTIVYSQGRISSDSVSTGGTVQDGITLETDPTFQASQSFLINNAGSGLVPTTAQINLWNSALQQDNVTNALTVGNSSPVTSNIVAINYNLQQAAIALNDAKNSYPATDASKLAGIETAAKDDQTGAEILGLLNAIPDVNQYTDAEKLIVAEAYVPTDTADGTLTNLSTQYDLTQLNNNNLSTIALAYTGNEDRGFNLNGNGVLYFNSLGTGGTSIASIGGDVSLLTGATTEININGGAAINLFSEFGSINSLSNIDMEGNDLADVGLIDLRVAANGSHSWQMQVGVDSSLEFNSSLGGVNLFKLKRDGATESGDIVTFDDLPTVTSSDWSTHQATQAVDFNSNRIDALSQIVLDDPNATSTNWNIRRGTGAFAPYEDDLLFFNSAGATIALPRDGVIDQGGHLTTKDYVDGLQETSTEVTANTTITTGFADVIEIFGGTTVTLDLPNWVTGEKHILKNYSSSSVTVTVIGASFLLGGTVYNTGNTYLLLAGETLEVKMQTAGGNANAVN